MVLTMVLRQFGDGFDNDFDDGLTMVIDNGLAMGLAMVYWFVDCLATVW